MNTRLSARQVSVDALHRLFDLQDELIEHKFPHNHIAVHEYLISCAGDIYREMAKKYPNYGYIYEKWSTLQKWCRGRGHFTVGDYEEYEQLMKEPYYEEKKKRYLPNLQRLKDETAKTTMEPKRKDVMMSSLEMTSGLIKWFETLRPVPPQAELEKLTDAVSEYFPKQFYEFPTPLGEREIPAGSNPGSTSTDDLIFPALIILGIVLAPAACLIAFLVEKSRQESARASRLF